MEKIRTYICPIDLSTPRPAPILEQLRELRRCRGNNPNFGTSYAINASHIESYDNSFGSVLGRREKIADMIKRKRDPVVIDFMAHPATVKSLLKEARARGGVGMAVNYSGNRTVTHYKAGAYSIINISGDIALRGTWRDVESVLEGRRANLIMERAIMGMENVPNHKIFYVSVLNRAWRILEPNGGTLLFETPTRGELAQAGISGEDLMRWADALEKARIGAALKEDECTLRWHVRLTRHPNSPNELPQLKSGA